MGYFDIVILLNSYIIGGRALGRKGVYLNRDDIERLIFDGLGQKYESFNVSQLEKKGNAYRCIIMVDNKKALLDFYFNKDNTTTIQPTGQNQDISQEIKKYIEDNASYSSTEKGKTSSFKGIPFDYLEKFVTYMQQLTKNHDSGHDLDTHKVFKFSSHYGDMLTVTTYTNGTLVLQGKPAYLYSEALSFLSYCNKVQVEDILDSINTFYNVSFKPNSIMNELSSLLPRSSKEIDYMILKILSPSIALRKLTIPLEDFSCYVFPALKALEGYIKYLFGLKDIDIGNNFYKVFYDCKLTPEYKDKIGNSTYIEELENLYSYWCQTRHNIFHTEQILEATTILEDKIRANEIVNDVLKLIENSYINITDTK